MEVIDKKAKFKPVARPEAKAAKSKVPSGLVTITSRFAQALNISLVTGGKAKTVTVKARGSVTIPFDGNGGGHLAQLVKDGKVVVCVE